MFEAARALGRDDPDIAAIALTQLRAEGVTIHEEATVSCVSRAENETRIAARRADGVAIDTTASHLLVATGRRVDTTDLNLAAAGIAASSRGIDVDAGLRTANRRVYAIGDCIGGVQLTHIGGYHAGLVVRSALFRLPVREDREGFPWVTFTDPEVGHAGLTEKAACARFGDARVQTIRVPYGVLDRAQAERRNAGLLKMTVGPRGRLLGADIAGAEAGEIVNLLSLAIAQKLTMRDLVGFISPYPTLSEIVRRAAVSYYAPSAQNPWVRRLVRLLQSFG